jgi:hypothetical protein
MTDGLPFCRVHLVQVVECKQEIADRGAEVALVVFDEPSLLHGKMRRDLSVPYRLLVDAEKAAYARRGMGRAV